VSSGYDLLQEHLPKLAARLLRAQLVDASGKAYAIFLPSA
jgi:hypothetical protein